MMTVLHANLDYVTFVEKQKRQLSLSPSPTKPIKETASQSL